MTEKPYHDEETLRELYFERDFTLREIADRFDVNESTIRHWMDKYEIPRRLEDVEYDWETDVPETDGNHPLTT